MESILLPDWEKEALVLGVLLLLDKFRLPHLLSGQILSVAVHIPTHVLCGLDINHSEQRVFRFVDDALTSRCTPKRSRAKARVTGMLLVFEGYSY